MRASRGELKIVEILASAGLNFKEEYSFSDLRVGKGTLLRFDFAIFDDEDEELQFLIEYQGIQHYVPKSKFGGTSALYKQRYNDKMKVDYCKKHHIKLLVIPYTDYEIMNYDYIAIRGGLV